MKDSVVIVNWGMRFLKGGGEASAQELVSIYSRLLGSNNVFIICARFCLTRKVLDSLESFNAVFMPTPIVYWSSCSSRYVFIRFVKQVIKWSSITFFEIIATVYVLLFKRGSLLISSDLYILAFILSYFMTPESVYLRLHGPVKNPFHILLTRYGRFKIISNGNDRLISLISNDRILTISVPLPSYFHLSNELIDDKWKESSYRIVYIGRLEYVKGADRIVAYLDKISKLIKLKSARICGDGSLFNSIEDALKYNPGLNVTMLGTLDRKEVADELSNSHFLLLPSRMDFAPNVVREAHSLGCVVITSPELKAQFENVENIITVDSLEKNPIVPKFIHNELSNHNSCRSLWESLLNITT